MKKTLFLTACVAVAALFVACEPKGEETGNKFEFRESAIVLAEGSTQRLALVDDQNANDYVWESSDTLVVTVDELGVATGEGTGVATVTVTSGERKATCQVTVKPFMETLSFPMAIVWDIDVETLDSIPDTIVVRESGEYKCVWGIAELRLMSEGLYYGNDGYLTGAEQGEIRRGHSGDSGIQRIPAGGFAADAGPGQGHCRYAAGGGPVQNAPFADCRQHRQR